MSISGGATVSFNGTQFTPTASGCADLQAGTFAFRLATGSGPITLFDDGNGNSLVMSDLSFQLTGSTSGAKWTVSGSRSMSATVAGHTATASAVIGMLADGTFVVGGQADLSQWISGTATGSLYTPVGR